MMNHRSGKTWSMLLDNKKISFLKKWLRTDTAKSGQGWFCILLVWYLGDRFSRHFTEESCMEGKMRNKMVRYKVCCMLCNKTERLACKQLGISCWLPLCRCRWQNKEVMVVDFLKSPKELVKEHGTSLMSYSIR